MAVRARPSSLPILLLLLLPAGCASATGSANPFAAASGASRIHIKVQNDNFYDATIWAVVNGARQQKLGVVTGKQNADFTMAWTVPRILQLEIDLMTGNMSCRTDALTVDPGDDLELQITADFGQMRGCR
ncbi:MAG: hypothetical protein LJF06_14950 [Gemmatimonadetes bacterium]|nr:hypothetical protein [Gemmatimonadota bacterium]